MPGSPQHIEELNTLHARLVDARNGYDEGLKLASDAAIVAIFRDLLEIRDRHIAELEQILKSDGESPDDDGTWMTPVHKSIMNARAWFGALDESAVDGVIDCEERIVEQFDQAIAAWAARSGPAIKMREMRGELVGKIDKLKQLADA